LGTAHTSSLEIYILENAPNISGARARSPREFSLRKNIRLNVVQVDLLKAKF